MNQRERTEYAATCEIDRLADFIMEAFPDEIGRGDFTNGESAVDVAIRLLVNYKIVPSSRPVRSYDDDPALVEIKALHGQLEEAHSVIRYLSRMI